MKISNEDIGQGSSINKNDITPIDALKSKGTPKFEF